MNIDSSDMDVDDDSFSILSPAANTSVSWVAPPSQLEASSTDIYQIYTDAEGLWVIYRWKPSNPDARIQPFYNRWPPSHTSSRACAWIGVDCGLSPSVSSLTSEEFGKTFKRDVDGLRAEFDAVVRGGAGTGQVTPELIDALAVKYGVLSGKWLIYSKQETVDQLWRRVVRVVAFDRGYGQLKVSTRKVLDSGYSNPHGVDSRGAWEGGIPAPGGQHVICVYVDDYTNREEVDGLRKALRFRANVHWRIGFKPDVYTLLEIYKGNEWGIRPSRYHDSDNERNFMAE